jgi:hypothetical protein
VEVEAVFDEPLEDGWLAEVPVEPDEGFDPEVCVDEEPDPVCPEVVDPDGLVVAEVEVELPEEPCAVVEDPLAEDALVVVAVAEAPEDGWVLEAVVDELEEEDAFAWPPVEDVGDCLEEPVLDGVVVEFVAV